MEMRLLSAALEDEIEAAQSETLELIKTLCRIPAPSHREERRAEALCRREKAHQRRFDGLQYPAVAGDSVGELRHVSRRRRAHAGRMDRAILALRRNEGGGQRADELV